VRWAEGDPLERLSFRALMLNAEAAADALLEPAADCRFESLDRDRLADSDVTLAELFGLLVQAHYRTSPNDLRHLLDGPDVRLYVLRSNGHIAATAVVAEEGGLEAGLAQAIYRGERRAHGHLMAQSLAVHAGFAEAPTLRGWRVVRIAVHPALRRRGFGAALLRQLQSEAQTQGIDYVGASFGADEPLLAFWQAADWQPVRIGLSRDAASGAHSVMVMKPLSDAGESLFAALRLRFAEQLPLLLAEPLTALDAGLAVSLFRGLPLSAWPVPTGRDWDDIRSFAETKRGYEVCLLALWRLLPGVLADVSLREGLDAAKQKLLLQKVLQRQAWADIVEAFTLRGKADALKALRESIGAILVRYRDSGRWPPSED
jgi:tRNA(Met) cytidine acetyltransferase